MYRSLRAEAKDKVRGLKRKVEEQARMVLTTKVRKIEDRKVEDDCLSIMAEGDFVEVDDSVEETGAASVSIVSGHSGTGEKLKDILGQQDTITLCVGGATYKMAVSTLRRAEDLLFKEIADSFSNDVFIDRDNVVFHYIVSFLRHGEVDLPDSLKERRLLRKEAEFYGLQGLLRGLDS